MNFVSLCDEIKNKISFFASGVPPLSIVFNSLVIHGESRDVTLMVPLGIIFDILFRNISEKVLTCQLGSWFSRKCHGKLVLHKFLPS